MRFSSFNDPFRIYTLKEVLQRVSIPVNVDENKLYYQIGIRSHSKGIFYKEAETGKQIGNKRIFWIEQDCLILNIVFAWEQAVSKTSEKEVGMVASHRFPMYKVLNNSLDYIVDFFKTEKGKQLLQMASPSGAGRNKTLNQDFFLNSKIYLPSLNEQSKTSKLIKLIEDRIETQSKIISDYTFLLNLLRDKLLYDKNHKKIKLSTLISIYNGYAFKSNNYKANAKYKIITIGNVTGDRYINLDSINTIDKLPSDIQQHQIIKNGSILVSLTGNVGRTSICNEDDCLLNQRVALVKSKNINEKFIYHILSSSRFLNKMISSSQGAAQKNISTKDILNYEITLLSKERMEYVTLLLEKIENKINYEKNILEHLYTQKQYLLKNMFI